MANYREDFAIINLETGTISRNFMNHSIGGGDALGDRFGVRVFRNGEAVTLGGTCAGYFVRNTTGETVVITGGVVSGNEAYVTLPAACYAVEGSFTLAIKVTVDSEIVTLRIVDGVVDRTNTSVIVDPGDILPSIEDLLQAIEDAVESIPADYSSLWTSLAPAFSTSIAYKAGQYVTYDGKFWRFTTDHAAGSWNAAHATQVNVGGDMSDLKSALEHHPIGYTDIVSSMVDEDFFRKTISGTATWQYVSKSITLPAGDYIITLYDMHIPSVGYFQIGLTLTSAEILGHTTAEGKYEFTLSAETTIIPKVQINLGDGVTAGTYYVRYAIYNASNTIIPEYATGIDKCVKKDGTGEVQTKNISGMKETDEFINSDNIFSTDLLKYEGKYPYISGSTGKIVYGGNSDFNTYLMPVSGGIYNFTFVSYGVLLEADQETAVGSWIQSATQINTTGASYLAFSFKPSVYSPSNYVVTEKVHIWETPKEWRLNTNNYSKYVSKEGSIASGDSFYIDDIGTGLKDGYIVAFKGYITSFGSIKLGFGSATNAITVDSTNVTIKNGYTADVVLPHGLTIANELSFIFELVKGVANITVGSNGGLFKTTVDWIQLNASNGTPTIISTSTVMTDCELRIIFNAAERKTWVLGDSYISVESNKRWTYYLNQYNWFTNSLFQGVPGMYSSSDVTALKRLLRFGKPKRIVFASGMNDGTDGADNPNTNWKNARDEFLSVCEGEGIEPVFATVPTVTGANPPTTLVNNEKKNTWIRSSGYRYIDFAKAVGANSSGVWYSGMLGSDGVHPTEQGAKALFTQAITDLPELMMNE